jgi:hypothetical protein
VEPLKVIKSLREIHAVFAGGLVTRRAVCYKAKPPQAFSFLYTHPLDFHFSAMLRHRPRQLPEAKQMLDFSAAITQSQNKALFFLNHAGSAILL